MKRKLFQLLALSLGIGGLLYALGLYWQVPLAIQSWIWPAASPLGLAFVGSWMAGGAAALIWAGLVGRPVAVRPIILTGLVAFGGAALHLLLRQATGGGSTRYLFFGLVFSGIAILAGIAYIRLRHYLPSHNTAIPTLIRWTFLLISAIVMAAGVALIFHLPHIFPIPLAPDVAVVYGWFFLGSGVYYAYGFLRSSEYRSTGHLLSLFVYDLLLLPPFLTYWPAIPTDYRNSLVMYLTILITSAIVCIYFLSFHPGTRLYQQIPAIVSAEIAK